MINLRIENILFGNFKIDKNNKTAFAELIDYLASGNPKGLLLTGAIGSGKTTMMEILRRYYREYDYKGYFLTVSAPRLASLYSERGNEVLEWAGRANGQPLFIDDLGLESIPATYYSTKMNVLQYILLDRYKMPQRTFLTTNLTDEELSARYGLQVTDRLKEMCVKINLYGGSRRK